ncbi:hypothetical protein COB55_01280 [Candidatus Wolfebacteria bacterium]|nr:MAG: hypothetical protein COB55_01280 [Candidatus Wolfebacteria bacterium]
MNTTIQGSNTPTIFIIFGITGDLAKAKLIPALFNLYQKQQLPDQFKVIGFARRSFTNEEIRALLRPALEKLDATPESIEVFLEHVIYHQGHFDETERYKALDDVVSGVEREFGVCTNKILHLSVRPTHYDEVIDNIAQTQIVHGCSDTVGWARILIEKPFGESSDTARALDEKLRNIFQDEQIFRVDHYLGKGGVRDIEKFRFENGEMEAKWNKDSIEKITVNLLESNDADTRGAFYDAVGALRDVGQNHLLEMLAQVVMDNPEDRADILKRLSLKEIVTRAQYEGFRDVEGVLEDSNTETFFHVIANIENDRWNGVAIHLISGKALDRSEANVTVDFKDGTKHVFIIQPVSSEVPDAYENVFADAIVGEQKYFVSLDEVVASWDFIEKVEEVMKGTPLTYYKKGSKLDN